MEAKVISHQSSWKDDFQFEKKRLNTALGKAAKEIHHIGSTSVPGIVAKPIIDILVVAEKIDEVDLKNPEMKALGYECMGEFGIPGRRYFRKDNLEGKRTRHIHVFQAGSPDVDRHLAFRDYLIHNPEKSREYSDLKKALTSSYPNDIEAYMDGKDPFIKQTESEALAWWRRVATEGSKQAGSQNGE